MYIRRTCTCNYCKFLYSEEINITFFPFAPASFGQSHKFYDRFLLQYKYTVKRTFSPFGTDVVRFIPPCFGNIMFSKFKGLLREKFRVKNL